MEYCGRRNQSPSVEIPGLTNVLPGKGQNIASHAQPAPTCLSCPYDCLPDTFARACVRACVRVCSFFPLNPKQEERVCGVFTGSQLISQRHGVLLCSLAFPHRKDRATDLVVLTALE